MGLSYDRALVTGGAGFIGSHTVGLLLQAGAEVWALDDLSTGSLANLRAWRKHRRFRFKLGTVTDYNTVRTIVRRVDAIIHLAAIVSPAISLRRPELTHDVNVAGTLNVVNAAIKEGVNRIVIASSSSVYGNASVTPTPENVPLTPITPYGVSKLAAEQYCLVFHKIRGLESVALRYFNVYGNRQRSNPYSGVVAIFMKQLLKGQRPVIYGDGHQTRDFIHVSDVARANVLALESNAAIGQPLNIGTGQATSISRLLLTIAEVIGRAGVSPLFAEPRPGDVKHSCADTTRAKRILGFESKVKLRQGLEMLVD